MFFIAEVFCHGQTGQADAHTGSRRFVHLAVDEGRLVDDAGFLHFVPKVIAFTRTFADAGEDGIAAVAGSDVVDEFHDEDGLADTSAAEEADLAAFGIRADEVDDFDPRFKDFRFRRLVLEFRDRTMDRPVIIGFDFSVDFIDSLAEDVEDTAQDTFADGDLDGTARIFSCHAADEAVRRVHGNAADDVVAQVLHDFYNQVDLLVAFATGDMDGVVNGGQICFRGKPHVDDRADDLDYFPNIITHEEVLLSFRMIARRLTAKRWRR